MSQRLLLYRFNLESVWYQSFKKAVDEDTELGVLISHSEAVTILNSLTEQAAKANLSKFLDRWNDTGMWQKCFIRKWLSYVIK